MNILITGGAGYIGSHLVRHFLRAGDVSVVVFDSMERGAIEPPSGIVFVKGDIGDKTLVLEILRNNKIHAVVHCAGYIQVGESQEKPDLYMENNVRKGGILLEAMKERGVRNIVFSSSAAVYGAPRAPQISEEHPREPINVYGKTKMLFEDMLKEYALRDGFRSIALRYFNVAGTDPEHLLGEWHVPETHIIPLILRAAAGKGDMFLYGDDYDTKDGTCLRDYIHVCDVARAHTSALKHLFDMKEGGSESFNIGSGRGTSNWDLIKEARKITGKDIKAIVKVRRVGDPPVLVADRTKAKHFLGWEPTYGVEDMIEHAWKTIRVHSA